MVRFFNIKLFSLFILLPLALAIEKERDIIERNEQLNSRLNVKWEINFPLKTVTFTLTGTTSGFIGFGISNGGGMENADVIIGGVDPNGRPYFSDRYSTKKEEPKIDEHQDWFLISAMENATHTILHFNRSLDTCDPQDLPLTDDTIKLIWSLGATDEIVYHVERGTKAVNILDPPMPSYDTSKFEIWDAMVNTTIPSEGTTYWCTIHKSPEFNSKRQFVGFEVLMESEEAVRHNHHLIIQMCKAPSGTNITDVFEGYVGHPGGLCYENDGTGIQNIFQYCQTSVYLWTKGGGPTFLPENVGFPINEDGGSEYFVMEIHYDNPQILSGVTYETGLRVYVTDDLRPLDAGLLAVSYAVDITQTIPPSSRDFTQAAHCSSRCTQNQIPPEGVEIFNIIHHAHLSAKKIKFRQFRPQPDGKFIELPWVSFDNKYDFDFQSNRPLKTPVKILPGDHFTVECEYDTTWKDPPTATFGGLSTRDEMCEVIFMYYPQINLAYCGSFHPLDDLLPILGIEQLDPTSSHRDPTVLKPEELAGKNFTTVVNKMVEWTPALRTELEDKVRFNDHVDECTSLYVEIKTEGEEKKGRGKEETFLTNYPKDFQPFVPPPGPCDV